MINDYIGIIANRKNTCKINDIILTNKWYLEVSHDY